MPVGHLYVFFEEKPSSIPAHFLIVLFGGGCLFVCSFFNTELHELFIILEINPLSVTSLANIFSQSVSYLFIL